MSKKLLFIVFLLVLNNVESASLLERSYEYVMNIGKNIAPSLMSLFECIGENDSWGCAKQKASKLIDDWEGDVDKQKRRWQDAADAEVISSGRSLTEMPSKLGMEVEETLISLEDLVQHSVARALGRKHDSGGIDSITISTGGEKKKKMKNKNRKPPKIHLVHPMMVAQKHSADKGLDLQSRDGFGRDANGSARVGRDFVGDMWSLGEKALDGLADDAMESDNVDNGVDDKSSVQEQRGKKKKKKKAILKLLILGAVLKAKIGTLLQILSFKLQLKFFLIALIGLGINFARFWLDLKKQHQQPQKVIYYEHAQHQHHYEHEDEPGWGPWSRSMDPQDEVEVDLDVQNEPYRGHINGQSYRPLTRV